MATWRHASWPIAKKLTGASRSSTAQASRDAARPAQGKRRARARKGAMGGVQGEVQEAALAKSSPAVAEGEQARQG